MGKPLSWKWKLTITLVVLALAAIMFLFSDYGYNYMRDGIQEEYEKMPEADRRDSPLADRFLNLANWRSLLMDSPHAMEMYKEFCGVRHESGTDIKDKLLKLDGLCSQDGKLGWGPLHPRAPEAYYNFILLYDSSTNASSQWVQRECFNYYYLFYKWPYDHTKDHKPHPNFMCYWPRIKRILAHARYEVPYGVDMNSPMAPKTCPDADIEAENRNFQ